MQAKYVKTAIRIFSGTAPLIVLAVALIWIVAKWHALPQAMTFSCPPPRPAYPGTNKVAFTIAVVLLSALVTKLSVAILASRDQELLPSLNILLSGVILWKIPDMTRCNLGFGGLTRFQQLQIVAALALVSALFALPFLRRGRPE